MNPSSWPRTLPRRPADVEPAKDVPDVELGRGSEVQPRADLAPGQLLLLARGGCVEAADHRGRGVGVEGALPSGDAPQRSQLLIAVRADHRTIPEIHTQIPLPTEVLVGSVRVPAMIYASRDTKVGRQVLVSLRARLSWIAAHRVVPGPGLAAGLAIHGTSIPAGQSPIPPKRAKLRSPAHAASQLGPQTLVWYRRVVGSSPTGGAGRARPTCLNRSGGLAVSRPGASRRSLTVPRAQRRSACRCVALRVASTAVRACGAPRGGAP